MCGIVGYVGKRTAQNVLLNGLKRLEYRGYDSAGIATLDDNNNPHIARSVGKIAELESRQDCRAQQSTRQGTSDWPSRYRPYALGNSWRRH